MTLSCFGWRECLSERHTPFGGQALLHSGPGLQIQVQNKFKHCCRQPDHVFSGLVFFGKIAGALSCPGNDYRIGRRKTGYTGPEFRQFLCRGLPDITVRVVILKFHGLV